MEHWLPPGTPGSTGGTLYNYQLVECLSRHAEVEVVLLNAPDRSVPDGVKLTTFQEKFPGFRGSRVISWRSTLMSQLPKDGVGRILITTTSTNTVIGLAKKRGYKTISIVQAYEDFGVRVPGGSMHDRLKGFKKRIATSQWFSAGLLKADHIVANSDYMRRALGGILECRRPISIVHPPLTLGLNLHMEFSLAALNSVGFVHRTGKNLAFLIELALATPQKQFLVFGHPIQGEAQLPDNMKFCGWASDRRAMFQQASTWVMPSLWSEPFGLVAVEALSQGCRVAVSRRGGLPEAVGLAGAIFDDFNVHQWANWLMSEAGSCVTQPIFDHLDSFSIEKFEKGIFRAIDGAFFGCQP